MITIGLTGMSGSGKTYVSELFLKEGISVINADHVVHKLYSSCNDCTKALKATFGEEVLFGDHSVNRKKLASIVFSDKTKLARLNATVHPFVVTEIREEIRLAESRSEAVLVVEAPQLFEARLESEFTYIISIIADKKTRISRIMKRDRITYEEASMRLRNQHPDSFFIAHSDYVIDNSLGNDPHAQLETILHKIGLYE
ncbi:MAG: dephospho-CoA kinase [Clostridia bacterium]|nr:dephospho-CoA kinase [Clostridia bacterium]